MRMRSILAVLLLTALLPATTTAAVTTAPFTVDAKVVVSSLMAITDGHFRTMKDSLAVVAASDEARSGDWARIKPLLAQAAKTNVEAGFAYAKPDGSFLTLAGEHQVTNIGDRPYFKTAMGGTTVIAEMVLSRTTNRPIANVALPVRDSSGKVSGVIVGAIYLDSLSKLVRQEMSLNANDIFFSFNKNALVGINWDPKQIFLEARKISPDIDRAFGTMLQHDGGVESYTHRGTTRTVVYRKSNYTGWWYAFGVVH